jgi:RNA polymerase sigma factor (TIGR02999 family)
MTDQAPLTEWLRAASGGDNEAGQRAYAAIYGELRHLARRQISFDRFATLTPTELVSEAFLKLSRGGLALDDRRHFFHHAARALRQIVTDHARERLAEKRGGDLVRTELTEGIPHQALDAEQALAIEQAFGVLDRQDPELAQTLSLCVYTGLSVVQIAELRGVTERTIQRELSMARNYVRLAMAGSA